MRKILCTTFIVSFLAVLSAFPPQAWAWGSPGHMAVAYVAWQQLNPTQKARILILLQQNPYYSRWTGYADTLQLTGDDRDRALFMYAATWPDEIKSAKCVHNADPKTCYTGTDNPPHGVTGTETGGTYDDMLTHKYWHFVNTPYVPGSSTTTADPGPNAQLEIAYLSSNLNAASSDAIESYDLVWLEHLVGDIHQPLHATARFTNGKSDLGGLNVKLRGDGGELHAYWDDLPGKSDYDHPENDYATAMAFAATLQPASASQVADLDPSDWTTESYNMAKDDVYVAPIGSGLGPFKIDPLPSAYATQALADAQARVELAGERLAALIEANLK